MVLSWTKGRVFRRAHKGKKLAGGDLEVEVLVPAHFRCPVTMDLMRDPVTLSTGVTYDRDSIEKWFESGNQTCPVTNQVLNSFEVIPNHAIRRMIQDWCVEHKNYGIERIPTPRIPVAPYQISETCDKIIAATRAGDDRKCQELVGKIKTWGKESERNKRCVVENGSGAALADAFGSFSSNSIEKNAAVLYEILGVLPWISPIGEEGKSKLSSEASLRCMVWFLNGKDLSAKQNAALLLKEMPVNGLTKIEGVAEALVNLISEPIGSSPTKASLRTIFRLVSSSTDKGRISEKFVELGLVPLLLEALVDGDRGTCERALGVLDCLFDSLQGKKLAKENALTMPVIVKKILRVSELASEFAVSLLWKLCEKNDEGILIEAAQVGAFQKLLVLLQVGCGESTKEKATELLKLLHGYKSKTECVDSSLDLKHLKKPY